MDSLLRYAITRTEAPVLEVVSLAEAKKQVNEVSGDDDALLSRLISTATEQVERDSGRALLTQTWKMIRDAFPGTCWVALPRAPLQSVASVKYYDTAGVLQTWPITNYLIDTVREPGLLWLADDADWPSLVSSRPNPVEITYVCGWKTAAEVPQRAKHAVLLLVAHWYRSREPVAIGTISSELELTYQALIASLRPHGYP